jgi:two-component system chemotaxis response regulator CheY
MAKTILVVDDSAALRRVVALALVGAGYEVIEAGDGLDALAKTEQLAGKKIHLVISDVNMPRMDGIEFVTELKKRVAFKFTPVIMLTTEGDDEVKNAGRAAGVKAWIIKPFNPGQMLNAVTKLILA